MKKITITNLMALAVLAIACSKNEPADSGLKIPSEDTENTPSDFVSLTFGIQTEELPSSKTTYTDGTLAWEEGDKIKVLFGEESNETEAENTGATTNFTVSVPEEATAIYFAYPSSENVTLADDALTLTIPSETDGSFVNANYMIAKALPADETVTFYHAGVIFKVVIEDPTITKAVIIGNNGEALAGTLAYTFTENGISYGEASETSTSLTMNFAGAGTYYASALPGLELASGATVRFYRGEEQAGGNKVTSVIPVARAKVASFGKDVEMINRYVSASASGQGNGRTETAAWNMEQFKLFMEGAAYDTAKYEALDGITVHLLAGDHTTASQITLGITNKVNIIGTDGAVIRSSASDYRFIECKKAGVDLSFENITFEGFTATSDGGVLAANDGTITFQNCTFSNNKALEGGVTNSWNEAIINLVDCDFYNNSTTETAGKGGGAVKINGGTLNVVGCNFSQNHCTGGGSVGGGAVYLMKGNSTFTECVFDGNDTNTSIGYNTEMGGAVSIKNGTHKFNNCLFTGNSATQGGAVCVGQSSDSTPTAYFNNCAFTGNYIAYRYGTTIYSYGSSMLCMNNCSFADDTYSTQADNSVQCAWLNLKSSKVILSNTTIIGTHRINKEAVTTEDQINASGLVRVDGNIVCDMYFINSIIAQTDANRKSVVGGGEYNKFTNYASKMGSYNRNNGTYTSVSSSEYNHSYLGTSDYLADLSWATTGTASWNNRYWFYTSLTGHSNVNKNMVKLTDVNTQIKNADSGFYNWLEGLGTLDKDCRGKQRGTTTWPGAYDATNN